MTDDELFTAVYLVLGSLPSKPESQNMISQMSKIYRRKLPDGREQMWLVDGDAAMGAQYDMRIIYDPAYMEMYDKAASFGLSMQKFSEYIAWAEAYESRREKI